jgi:exodeoxyribonuclease-3
MKLISWNVNGIRSATKKGFLGFLKKQNPDIICLQEIKATESDVDLTLPNYHQHWNSAKNKKGYSGTAVFTKIKPENAIYDFGIKEHDEEGRVVTLEFSDFFLTNVYTPNSKRDLSRLSYREEWDRVFLKFVKKWETKKPVIFCGDLNVAHKEIDLTHPESNHKNHGFTDEERTGFANIVKAGFLDTFREFTSDGGHYTWWNQMHNCRARNIGWRIDYFCVSATLRPYLKDAFILPEVMGSDHCPVGIEIAFS